MKEKIKNCLILFYTFFKIGLFTFGGGYGMIGIIQEQAVEKHKWIKQDEFFEILIIAESTPGPIAVNMATYIGYKVSKFWGSFFATLGLSIPSLLIIFIISLFYEEFLSLSIVRSAFNGIKVGVMILLITTVIKLMKKTERNSYFYIVFIVALITMICFTIWIPSFTWISLILIALGLIMGVMNTALANKLNQNKKKGDNK